jgi:hypothetical protein
VTNPVRVLHWSYASPESRCSCAISLDSTQLLYMVQFGEVAVLPGETAGDENSATVTVELFLHVARAFERQCELEADLLQRGFHLDGFHAGSTRAS